MNNLITKVGLIAGMGDALNARSFLVEYCKQKDIQRKKIKIYTERYYWMFEGMGFTVDCTNRREFSGLIGYKNFGNYNLKKEIENDKLDMCIAQNAGISYNFDIRTPFQDFGPSGIRLPEKFVTINTGYGNCSGKPSDLSYVCIKSWPIKYWETLVKLIGVPVVNVGYGISCKEVSGVALDLRNKTSIQQTGSIMRKALFHIDIEGGLVIFNQHLGGMSVVLFGPTGIENQGRSFNLNLSANTCEPCYEWGTFKHKSLCCKRPQLECKAHCMLDLKPEYVVEQIYKNKWL